MSEPVDLPVARVAVDISLPHLDRPFDYAVPAELADQAVPGVRVRVRFAGRLRDGFVLERVGSSDHRLAALNRVISPIPVLTPATLALARAVADRYAGSLADVLRAAIPPRHARAESSVLDSPMPEVEPAEADHGDIDRHPQAWSDYVGGEALLRRIQASEPVRAVVDFAPADSWPARIVDLASQRVRDGGSLLVILPDARDVQRVDNALTAALGRDAHEVLTADIGPQRRYAAFLRILTGRRRIVIGTRGASFAPVPEDALMVIIDDGEETMVEPHAPGWHAREVLALRSHLFSAPLIVGGFSRSVAAQSWIESGWAAAVVPRREVVRERAPRVHALDGQAQDDPARLPSLAWRITKDELAHGPVLMQVARRGYVPGLACQQCRSSAQCTACGGPLALASSTSTPTCRWCSSAFPAWRCPHCHGSRLRAMTRGAVRTAEELGRAFPGVRVIASGGDTIIDSVEDEPALVIATPGAEPVPAAGYRAVVLLDASSMLARASLGAGEETMRRWFNAAALARPGAPLVVTAAPGVPAVQALLRWDPGWYAARELADRTALRFPPVRRSATASGSYAAMENLRSSLPETVTCYGPIPEAGDSRFRLLLLADRSDAAAMIARLREALVTSSMRKETPALDIRIDPVEWGSALGNS